MEIPKREVTAEDINEWYRLQQELQTIKTKEMLLRRKIFDVMFSVQEGTEYVDLAHGYRLQAVAKLDRTLDAAHLDVMKDEFRKHKINVDALVKYKPELSIKDYRQLTDEQRNMFDQVLTIKPGAPSLKIVAPKEE